MKESLKNTDNDEDTTTILPHTTLQPMMAAYTLELSIEGKTSMHIMPDLIDALFLSWIIELFHDDKVWSVGCGYLWKSMKDKILGTLNLHMLGKSIICHMATSSIDFLGYSEGSCVPSLTTLKHIQGFRSWELHSEENLILINLKYKLTTQTFSHALRNNLRNSGFFLMNDLNKKDRMRLYYICNKRLKTGYTHERGFEKLLKKV